MVGVNHSQFSILRSHIGSITPEHFLLSEDGAASPGPKRQLPLAEVRCESHVHAHSDLRMSVNVSNDACVHGHVPRSQREGLGLIRRASSRKLTLAM